MWGETVPDGYGYVTLDLHSRVIDEDGSPVGASRRIGGGAIPSMLFGAGGQMTAIAADSHRQRQLVAWAAHKPGMGRTPCTPAPPVNPLFADQPARARVDNPAARSFTLLSSEHSVAVCTRATRTRSPFSDDAIDVAAAAYGSFL